VRASPLVRREHGRLVLCLDEPSGGAARAERRARSERGALTRAEASIAHAVSVTGRGLVAGS
jgi:hypothetical protein